MSMQNSSTKHIETVNYHLTKMAMTKRTANIKRVEERSNWLKIVIAFSSFKDKLTQKVTSVIARNIATVLRHLLGIYRALILYEIKLFITTYHAIAASYSWAYHVMVHTHRIPLLCQEQKLHPVWCSDPD